MTLAHSSDSKLLPPAFGELQQELLLRMLGPDIYYLRVTCRSYSRKVRKGVDLLREVLRWLCVNKPDQLCNMVRCYELGHDLECVGILPKMPCINCLKRNSLRQMYRFRQASSPVIPAWMYICCFCFDDMLNQWLSGQRTLFAWSKTTAASRQRCERKNDAVVARVIFTLSRYSKASPTTANMSLLHRAVVARGASCLCCPLPA